MKHGAASVFGERRNGPRRSTVTAGPLHSALAGLLLLSSGLAQEHHVIIAGSTDRSTGTAVGGIVASDLEIIQETRPYPVTSVRTMNGPKDIVFVIDNDLPVARQSLAAGARLAEYEFGNQDRAAVVIYGRKAKLEVPLTVDVRLALRHLDSIARSGDLSASKRHALYDAILLGIRTLPEENPGRQSHVVVFTMRPERDSKATVTEVIAAAARARVVVDGIVLAPKYLARDTKQQLGIDAVAADDDLRALSNPTGGESRIEEPGGYLLRQALVRIRNRFRLTGATRGSGPVSLRLTAQGKIKYPGIEFRILSDEVSRPSANAGLDEGK